MAEKGSWGFTHGDEIVPGRHAVRFLGGGSRYEAYLAWDDAMYALVAMKVVRPERTEDTGALAGLAGEVLALARLNHPVIVRLFDAELEGERPHVVLEYLDGPRLSTLLRRYGLAIEQTLSLGLQLCSALHYLAGQQIVHLDLKPRNIIMAGPPRLIDLSVARPVERLPDISSPVGTDAYMAPEQADPDRFDAIGYPSDVWGLGVCLYEALAAELPFPPGPERFPQLTADPAPLPPRLRVPPPLAEVVMACMAFAPAERPTPAEVAATLEPLVDALPRPRLGLFRPGGRSRR